MFLLFFEATAISKYKSLHIAFIHCCTCIISCRLLTLKTKQENEACTDNKVHHCHCHVINSWSLITSLLKLNEATAWMCADSQLPQLLRQLATGCISLFINGIACARLPVITHTGTSWVWFPEKATPQKSCLQNETNETSGFSKWRHIYATQKPGRYFRTLIIRKYEKPKERKTKSVVESHCLESTAYIRAIAMILTRGVRKQGVLTGKALKA